MPSLRQKSLCTWQMLWQGSPSTLRYPASHTHSASPDQRFTAHRENSLQAWNLHGSAQSPEEGNRENWVPAERLRVRRGVPDSLAPTAVVGRSAVI